MFLWTTLSFLFSLRPRKFVGFLLGFRFFFLDLNIKFEIFRELQEPCEESNSPEKKAVIYSKNSSMIAQLTVFSSFKVNSINIVYGVPNCRHFFL